MARRRGAVVIGVNKTGGGLQALESSASGANAFADWLKSEGFEVTTITDAAGKVEPKQIADAVAAFVRAGNCHQLVIYFSGHGFWKNDTELWLLSDAPGDANAAVSWAETAELAKDCGIPNVVLVSDACRSIPDTPQKMRVRGALVFPNEDVARSRAKIDKFMAAATGRPAYEIPLGAGGEMASAFTHCFLRAFKTPDRDMIQKVTEDGETIDVVPNRRLGKYLQREVSALLASVNIALDQAPDAEVLSDDDAYIGRASLAALAADVERGAPERGPAPEEAPVVHLRDVAALAIGRAMDMQSPIPAREMGAIEELAITSGFNAAVNQAKTIAEVAHFELETGFAVIGTAIDEVAIADDARAIILAAGDRRNPGVVRVELPGWAAGIALRFANGRGTVLAALRGYICHILVDGNSIINVSYVPSDNSWRWPYYLSRRDRIDGLRAAAAAAVRHGVFRLDDEQKAADLAEHIRVEKAFDPALGLYAAYAYAEADRRDDIESVRSYMQDDLVAELFDVVLLARTLTPRPSHAARIAPFCPMLTQGWNLLRAHRIALPKALDDAQDQLERALWTTFKPDRIRIILESIRRGEIK
jgi:Caspase domain